MGSKINRVGEENINNFGSKMIIIKYRKYSDIDVYFPEYDWIAKNANYDVFKKGNIVCPYEKRAFGVGYLGEGKHKASENGKKTKCYNTWYNMLMRCYYSKYHEKQLTYFNCEVDEIWHNLQSFGDWFVDNYYEVEGQKMCLDKDVLNKGNKVYSPENCIFVPNNINILFVKSDKSRGDYPIGVCYRKDIGKFMASCSIYDYKENKSKSIYLGLYDSPNKAFQSYKEFKENYIKEVADHYKDLIPQKLYNALYEYKIEIND